MINEFRGRYFFLSNFYDAPVMYDGFIFNNNEAAFQSAKVLDRHKRDQFCNIDASTAKRKGRHVLLRNDWEEIKDEVMYQVVKDKFTRNVELQNRLLDTGNEELVEGNTWNDAYWGVCNGRGKNKLGKILMKVRDELRS
jgi:ribA/ribD-fused uncharacterized protein